MSGRHTHRLASLALLLTAAAAAATPRDLPVTLPDGRVLNLWCQGKRGPPVILDSGWSADSRAWRRVLAALPRERRACAQDRAGSGRSSPGPLPRDARAVATDLAAALDAAGMRGRVVLVGHSLGALNMRAFAALHPDRVAGLVLVDPSVPGTGGMAPFIARAERCLAAARAARLPAEDPALARCATDPPDKAAERWEARLSEVATLDSETFALLSTQGAGSLPVPVVVLTAGRDRDPQALDLWEALHRQSAAISTKGSQRTVPQSGHLMMFDAPDAIAEAIRSVAAGQGESSLRR